MADVGEVIADVAEEVAEQASTVADISRRSSGRNVGLVFGGMAVGAGLGATGAFFFFRRRFELKYEAISQEAIAEMREHYQEKTRALEAKAAKQPLEEIVRERGYSSDTEDEKPPMAVPPPTTTLTPQAVVEAEEEPSEEEIALQHRREAAMEQDPQLRNVFEDHGPPEDHWDYQAELAKRSPVRPYVIHIDERQETAYTEATYTYYDQDDVLCNERDEVIAEGMERDSLVGEGNLDLFGHGSGDRDVVYIRNDRLELDMEICKSTNSYAQEVHGFDPPEKEIRHGERRRRPRFDDE